MGRPGPVPTGTGTNLVGHGGGPAAAAGRTGIRSHVTSIREDGRTVAEWSKRTAITGRPGSPWRTDRNSSMCRARGLTHSPLPALSGTNRSDLADEPDAN